MYFAKNLRFLRRRAELSQSELGDKLATDYNTISRYENSKSTPKLEALTKLADVFQVSLEALRNEDLTQAQAFAANLVQNPNPATPHQRKADRSLKEPAPRPAKHSMWVSVELDGTLASLERAVTRLTAINELVAETD